MKAKILKTGKIVDLIGVSKEWGTATYWDENHVLRCDNLFGGIELLDDKTYIDWEQRRYEIVKDLYCNSADNTQSNFFKEKIVVDAERQCIRNIIQCADILIEELKKKSNE